MWLYGKTHYSTLYVSGITTASPLPLFTHTETQGQDGDDITKGKEPLGNRLYRYELVNNKLVNPTSPATPGAIGIGGKVVVGPDNNVYVTYIAYI